MDESLNWQESRWGWTTQMQHWNGRTIHWIWHLEDKKCNVELGWSVVFTKVALVIVLWGKVGFWSQTGFLWPSVLLCLSVLKKKDHKCNILQLHGHLYLLPSLFGSRAIWFKINDGGPIEEKAVTPTQSISPDLLCFVWQPCVRFGLFECRFSVLVRRTIEILHWKKLKYWKQNRARVRHHTRSGPSKRVLQVSQWPFFSVLLLFSESASL